MASAEREQRLAGVYRGLAAAERRHAARWAEQLEQLGAGRPPLRPRGRARVLAWLSSATILVTGIAGLLAGALSMAMGEWISVQSSRELYTHQLEVERLEIATMPERETEELALIYRAKGIPTEDAHALAVRIMRVEDTALDAMAREELGIDPEELGGSAAVAAIASFLPFTFGAAVPVLPSSSSRAPRRRSRASPRARARYSSWAPRSRC